MCTSSCVCKLKTVNIYQTKSVSRSFLDFFHHIMPDQAQSIPGQGSGYYIDVRISLKKKN